MLSNIALKALSLDIPGTETSHPNRMPFRGILCRLDEPSTRAPHGSQGHRVLLPSSVARTSLPSLLGMAVNFARDSRGHAPQIKIGLITAANIVGRELVIRGFLYKKDFPHATAFVRAHKATLGMSYEIAQVGIVDPLAEVWVIRAMIFTGAAILQKSAAAYAQTSIAARSDRHCRGKESPMPLSIAEQVRQLQEHIALLAQEVDNDTPEEVPADDEDSDTPEEVPADEEPESVTAQRAGGRTGARKDQALDAAVALLIRTARAGTAKAPVAKPLKKVAPPSDDDTILADMIQAYRQRKIQASTEQAQRLASMGTTLKSMLAALATMAQVLVGLHATDTNGAPTVAAAPDVAATAPGVPHRKTQEGAPEAQWATKYSAPATLYAENDTDALLQSIGVLSHKQRHAFWAELNATAVAEQPQDISHALDAAGITDATHRIAIKHYLAGHTAEGTEHV